jgi:hypothetical protein
VLNRLRPQNVTSSIKTRWKRLGVNLRIWQLTRKVVNQNIKAQKAVGKGEIQPIIFFNASTRLVGLSQNAAFAMLSAMGLQLAGEKIIYFGCSAGMRRCVLGTQLDDISAAPPCRACIGQSRWFFLHAPVVEFRYREDDKLATRIEDLSLKDFLDFEYENRPLGELVLPSLRWVLRRHHLQDDEPTLTLYRDYILSANNVINEFDALVKRVDPKCIMVFNGMFFPEASARWTAQQHGIPVVTHEVGLRPYTAFFTYGQATAYPLDIPEDFQLSGRQNDRLDSYLQDRFKGQFSMAGVNFWKGMQGLDAALTEKIEQYRQLVSVFTNVIFDTSQPHSNVVFPNMFAWLELIHEIVRKHRDTFFVLRAHPDENRFWKESRESVKDWAADTCIDSEPNLYFIDPDQSISSYALIDRSKFVMIYNSTIGLEASILGKPVLCAGRARFTQLPTVFFPESIAGYQQLVERFLDAGKIEVPEEFQVNARRFLYYQLFRSSLPFGQYLKEDGIWTGFLRLKSFNWQDLCPEQSPAHRVLYEGIQHGTDFILPEDVEFWDSVSP